MSYEEYNKEIFLKFPNLPKSGEVPERLGIIRHLHPQSKVLEIGANEGGVSSAIAAVLQDSNNLVSVEPIESTCQGLRELGIKLGTPFRVFAGVIRGTNSGYINCKGEKNSYAICSSSSKSIAETENLTFEEIQERFKIQFDTVVIDCEGCYENFLQDILGNKNIRQIQIEWDGKFQEEEIIKSGFSLIAKYNHCVLPKGVRIYEKSYTLSTWILSGRLGNKIFQNCVLSAVAKYLNINNVSYALKEETEALGINLHQVAEMGKGIDDCFNYDKDLECWKDKSNDRQLSKNNGRSHSIQTCAFKAREFNHKYYSIQDTDECYTGNEDFSRHGVNLMCPWSGGEYIAHTFRNSSFFPEIEANDEEIESLLRKALSDPSGRKRTNIRLKFSSTYFYQNPFFAQFVYDILSKTKNERLLKDTSINENIFIHMRLGDILEENMERKLTDWVLAIQRALDRGGKNIFISSDSPSHARVKFIIKKFNAQLYEANPVETILFGSSCAHIIGDGGTFSWIICAMAYRSKSIQYLPKTKNWHGDIFVTQDWERV